MRLLTKEEKCKLMSDYYGWDLKQLLLHNESQIDTLYSACCDEDGVLRMKETKE